MIKLIIIIVHLWILSSPILLVFFLKFPKSLESNLWVCITKKNKTKKQ